MLLNNFYRNSLQNGTMMIELEHGKDNQSEYNFLIVCRYLNLVNNLRIVLLQIKTSQVATTLKFCTDYGNKYMLFSLKFACKGK